MSDAAPFAKFVPGFDFLQNLSKNNASAMPGVSSWVAPTLDPEELDKRITDLKAVMFWLEQNTTALKATIQALEVQKMTLATLKGMNMDMSAMAKAFKFPDFSAGAAPATSAQPARAEAAKPAQAAAPEPQAPAAPKARAKAAPKPAQAKTASVVDPLQLWGSLTQQFQQIAADALQEVTKQAAPSAKPSAKSATKKVAKKAPAKRATGRKP